MNKPKIDLYRVLVPGDRLLIRELTPDEVTQGGIIIPAGAQADRTLADVVLLGDEVRPLVAVGDQVIVHRYAIQANNLTELGEGYHIVNWSDVLAVVTPEAK